MRAMVGWAREHGADLAVITEAGISSAGEAQVKEWVLDEGVTETAAREDGHVRANTLRGSGGRGRWRGDAKQRHSDPGVDQARRAALEDGGEGRRGV